jgi:hypothetical protein
MPAVGQQHRGRGRRVRKRKPALFQFGPQLRIGRRGNEQDERRRHHIVDETRRCYLIGEKAAADPVIALEQQHFVAFAPKQRGCHERVDPTSDNDIVGVRHRPCPPYFLGTIASTRSGLPVPLTIFSGAAIRIAPLGGSLSS